MYSFDLLIYYQCITEAFLVIKIIHSLLSFMNSNALRAILFWGKPFIPIIFTILYRTLVTIFLYFVNTDTFSHSYPFTLFTLNIVLFQSFIHCIQPTFIFLLFPQYVFHPFRCNRSDSLFLHCPLFLHVRTIITCVDPCDQSDFI